MEYDGRSIEFIGKPASLGDEKEKGEYIFIDFKKDGKVIHSRFADYNLDTTSCILDWMTKGEVVLWKKTV